MLPTPIGRRHFAGLATAAISLPLVRARRAWAADTLTVTSYGGIFEDAIRKFVVTDFESTTGAKAKVLLGSTPQWMAQIDANRTQPPIDVLLNTVDTTMVAGRSGLVEKLTVDKVPNLADVPKPLLDMFQEWGAIFAFGSWGFAYHERLQQPPRSFAELVDGTAAGKWRVALPNTGYGFTPMVLIWSLADALGGSVDNAEPAFDAIKRMKPHAAFWASVPEPLTLLESGEADITLYPDGRTWAAYDSGAHWIRFINPKEGGVNNPSLVQKVKNGSDLGWAYINSLLAPVPQQEFGEFLNCYTGNSKVVPSEKVRSRVAPWQQCRFAPFDKVAAASPHWIERWNKEIKA
jgi:putative spermidine/putrescine transport system substrate-binding protein